MGYEIQGATYSPPPTMYAGDVSAIDFEFTFEGESTPEIEGENEPTAIDDDVDPPSGG